MSGFPNLQIVCTLALDARYRVGAKYDLSLLWKPRHAGKRLAAG
jgi:hypothetical protein